MLEFTTSENGSIETVKEAPKPDSYVNWGEEARTTQMRQAIITQAAVIIELKREVAKRQLIEELLDQIQELRIA